MVPAGCRLPTPRRLAPLLLLALTIVCFTACSRRPDPYGQQLHRALEAGLRGQELLAEGQTRRAARAFSQSLEIYQGVDNPAGSARQLNNLGAAALAREDLSQAADYFRQALFLNQALGSLADAALNLANLGTVAQKNGDFGQAAGYLQEARELAKRSQSRRVLGQVLCQLAGLALDQHDPGTAAALLTEAASANRDDVVRGPWHYQQGRLHLSQGNLSQARAFFQQALDADRAALNRLGLGADLQGLAQVEEAQGDYARAFLYASRAFRLYTATHSWTRAQQCLETLGRLNQLGRLGQNLEPLAKQLTTGRAAATPCPPPRPASASP
ncbi:MAG: tetratricopeptide repeat protein [Desulfobacca sp.]|uniref:tetratricopeptide repeat protein n=1 Tax=Desulfobacca sp. TaxID=2067990 RepID=UPI00404A1506